MRGRSGVARSITFGHHTSWHTTAVPHPNTPRRGNGPTLGVARRDSHVGAARTPREHVAVRAAVGCCSAVGSSARCGRPYPSGHQPGRLRYVAGAMARNIPTERFHPRRFAMPSRQRWCGIRPIRFGPRGTRSRTRWRDRRRQNGYLPATCSCQTNPLKRRTSGRGSGASSMPIRPRTHSNYRLPKLVDRPQIR